jgi:hypothetical protein
MLYEATPRAFCLVRILDYYDQMMFRAERY